MDIGVEMTYQRRIKEGYKKMSLEEKLDNLCDPKNSISRNLGETDEEFRKRMITKLKIYLAHPFDRRSVWKKQMIIKELEKRFIVVDPFDGEDEVAKKFGVKCYYDNPCREFALEIKKRDFDQLDECDCLFAWIPKGVTMIGTIREYDRAIRNDKYIIVLCYKPNPFLEDANELYLSYKDFIEGKRFEWR